MPTPHVSRTPVHAGFVVVAALFGLITVGGAARTSADLDLDGYDAIAVGGNDCVDSVQAAYQSNATTCNPNASPTFLESQWDTDFDDDIADHAWMRDALGLYHLYYQNEDSGSGDYIEHYTSADLRSLTYVGPAVQQTPGGWDRYGMWAPHVVKNPSDGLYYMFYAGTTAGGSNPGAQQRIGVATSSDLTTWTKASINNCSGTSGDGCVYECDEAWTMWGNGGSYADQCRDPFVIWDAAQSRWLMFTTVLLDNAVIGGPWTQGISVASSSDLLHWSGLGYIKASKRLWASEGGVGAQLDGGIAENPFVTEFNGDYYLFFTDSNDPEDYWNVPNPRTMVQYASTSELTASPDGSLNWTYRGPTRDPGVNAAEIQKIVDDVWLVSHSIVPNPYSGYWGSHTRDLRLKRLVWEEDGTFTTSNLWDPACRVPSANINPGVSEICGDGLDNDCANGPDDAQTCGVCSDADGDGYGTSGFLACTYQAPDCNDTNAAVHPGAVEYCEDGLDNNCSEGIDEPSCILACLDDDGDGYGRAGLSACSDPRLDCNDMDEFVNPGLDEVCSDSVDNNCNEQIDEPLCVGACIDTDGDGFGVSGLLSCASTTLDCNDSTASIRPGAQERCDRVDNDCDGLTDEGWVCPRRKPSWILCDSEDSSCIVR